MNALLRVFAMALILTLVFVACGDDDDDAAEATATPVAATASPTESGSSAGEPTASADDQAAVEETADEFLLAMQDRDRDRMHDFSGDRLKERSQDQDFEHLAMCMPEGASMQVVDRTVDIDDATATVTQALELTAADGTTTEVERVWTFERADDGTWELSEMPECPFQDD